jgi:hypothetical protein
VSKETRTIRPFVGLDDLQGPLEEAVLYFGQEPCLAGETLTVSLSPHEFLLRPVTIQWAPEESAHRGFVERLTAGTLSADLDLSAVSLVAVARSPFLKLAAVVLDHPLADLPALGRVVELSTPPRAAPFSSPFSGFVVDVYLVLSQVLQPEILKPHRLGTWLSTSRFRVETTYAPAALPPTPLNDEVRERHQLMGKTVRFLDFGDHDVTEAYTDQERPTLYIDEKLLAQMNARRNSPASKALQLQLALDFVSAVVRRASSRADLVDRSYDDLRNSLVGSVIRIAAGPGATISDYDRLVAQLADTPEYLVARAEHFIDVGSGYRGLLKEDE